MTLPCPDETSEEEALSDYCDMNGWTHWHVPQETFTKSWSQKRKNKRQGVRAGVSDHWVVLPTCKGHLLVAIELKRQHGNTPTDEQIEFLEDVDKVTNVVTVCCYGAGEAIDVLEELKKYETTTLDLCNDRMNRIKLRRQIRKKRKKQKKNTEKPVKTPKDELPY